MGRRSSSPVRDAGFALASAPPSPPCAHPPPRPSSSPTGATSRMHPPRKGGAHVRVTSGVRREPSSAVCWMHGDVTRSAADALLGRAGLFRYAVRRPRRPVRRRPRRQGRRRPRIWQRRPRWHDDARKRQGVALTGTRDPSAHAPGASPIAIPRFPSIGFTFVFATISPPSIRPVPQSKGRTMATAMKLSVPKPVNLPSMKKVRPRPDALTRNQRSALFFFP